jgi:hypothetical protein
VEELLHYPVHYINTEIYIAPKKNMVVTSAVKNLINHLI